MSFDDIRLQQGGNFGFNFVTPRVGNNLVVAFAKFLVRLIPIFRGGVGKHFFTRVLLEKRRTKMFHGCTSEVSNPAFFLNKRRQFLFFGVGQVVRGTR